ncbi:uncharacterized protein LOC144656078 [Oculina patagonica]
MKIFAQDLIDRFFVSHQQTRLGLVVFGENAHTKARLRMWRFAGRQHNMEKMIDGIPAELDNKTTLPDALQRAFDEHIQYDEFQTKKKSRTDARNVVIIFTDGKTQNRKSLKSLTKPSDVTVIAVALGRKARLRRNRKLLKKIADDVVIWTKRNGKSRKESEVLQDIMDNFDFTPCENKIPVYPSVNKFGCYSKTTLNGADSMDSMENDKCFLMANDSATRDQAFEKCAWLAWKRGYNTFGVNGNKQCSSGFVAWRFFKGGARDNCQDKLGGSDSNVVYYFKEIAPKVHYGSIVCLTSSDPVMDSIPKEEVDRMPGKTTAEKCAWAARKRQSYLFAVKTEAEECTSSHVGNAPAILNKLEEKTCTGRSGERELYFVGDTAKCTHGGRDIAIVADLERKNIQFLVTLVDTLDVDMKGHHVGLITTNDIKVKFSDEASQNETALLDEVRDAAKTAGFTPPDENYQAALTNVQEIFTRAPENGGRKDAKNVLLVITDNTEVFTRHPGTADAVNAMKEKVKAVAVIGFGDSVSPEAEAAMKSVASKNAAAVISTSDPVLAAEEYYKTSLNAILWQIC